jgi:ubiquinol-cytochrome c reductase iron-sulfur subunit
MADDKVDRVDDPARRDFLNTVTTVVAGAGVAAAAWPFIQSMNPTTDVLSKATTEVDLTPIAAGEMKTVAWQGKPVFILRRTSDQVAQMSASQGVKDPQADKDRVKTPEWLVVVGLCTHLGCVPSRKDEGWFCPCHGSVYDNSGRILHGPAPRNLEVPPYEFVADNRIVIGSKA